MCCKMVNKKYVRENVVENEQLLSALLNIVVANNVFCRVERDLQISTLSGIT